jgi:hypothetical protein
MATMPSVIILSSIVSAVSIAGLPLVAIYAGAGA